MPTMTRRRPSSDEAPKDERPARSRRAAAEEKTAERPARSRRAAAAEDSGEKKQRGGRATGGFSSFSSKVKRSGSGGNFGDKFNPEDDTKVLIKFLDPEPFDVYDQHWINERPKGEKNSFVCLDDDYFGDEDDRDECPLCEVGEPVTTMSLFNVLDLTSPDQPQVKVWVCSPTVTSILERASREKKTSPLDREDLYFEVERIKSKRKTTWHVESVKARDLKEDYEVDPFTADELAEFESEKHDNRTAVTSVDSVEDLAEIADSL